MEYNDESYVFEGSSKGIKHLVKNRKKITMAVIAVILAGTVAIGSGITWIVNLFKNKNKDVPKNPTSSMSAMNIEDLGTELEFPKEESKKEKYENPTGKVDVNKIVEKDGVVYADKENADKSDKVGTSSIDTKNDTLKVESNGTVKEKNEGYEIKDKNSSVISKGDLNSSGIPSDYEENKELGGTFEKEDKTEQYTIADADYYAEDGTLMVKKGDIVSKEDLANAKKNFSTVKPTTSSNTSSNVSSKPTTSSNTTTSVIDQGVVNANGTYTIFGITFESKADYQQWVLQGYEGYVEVDGIMMSEEALQELLQKTK
ncbi:MAG: hypothetical protein IKL65_02620 [Bacilli bacterium]|nr:hypothetical protein [Bacilli bacterium]